MKTKEPKFMQALHKTREKLAKKWKKMTSEEFLESLHDSGSWLKNQIALSRPKKIHQ